MFQGLNLPLTTFSTCPRISEGQTSATFSQHLPLMEWMILQSLVLQVTAESSIITQQTSASILLEIKNIKQLLTSLNYFSFLNMHKRMVRKKKRDWNAAFNYVYKFLNNSNLPELICHFKVQTYWCYVMSCIPLNSKLTRKHKALWMNHYTAPILHR